MVKKEKKRIEMDSKFWMSMFILAMMIFSIAGFAMMSGGGASTSDGGTPSEVPFQEFDYEGQVFFGAVKNSEQFVFFDIEGYDESFIEKSLADRIKAQTGTVEIYIDESFTSSDAQFLIEKIFRGLSLDYAYLNEPACNSNTIVLTANETLSMEGDCMYFLSSNEDAGQRAEVLAYHIVK